MVGFSHGFFFLASGTELVVVLVVVLVGIAICWMIIHTVIGLAMCLVVLLAGDAFFCEPLKEESVGRMDHNGVCGGEQGEQFPCQDERSSNHEPQQQVMRRARQLIGVCSSPRAAILSLRRATRTSLSTLKTCSRSCSVSSYHDSSSAADASIADGTKY